MRPGPSFFGADVVPDVDGDQRQAVVLVEDDLEAVGQLVLLDAQIGRVCRE